MLIVNESTVLRMIGRIVFGRRLVRRMRVLSVIVELNAEA